MSTCKYCRKPIEWDRNASGKLVPVNPDGSLHHTTCRAWHKVKAQRERENREAKIAYGLLPAIPENPNQMHFSF